LYEWNEWHARFPTTRGLFWKSIGVSNAKLVCCEGKRKKNNSALIWTPPQSPLNTKKWNKIECVVYPARYNTDIFLSRQTGAVIFLSFSLSLSLFLSYYKGQLPTTLWFLISFSTLWRTRPLYTAESKADRIINVPLLSLIDWL